MGGASDSLIDPGLLRRWIEAHLAERCADDADPATEVVELDQTRTGRLSRMDALQGQAMAKASSERRAHECARLRAALRRVTDPERADTVGRCLECDAPIAQARLRVDPAATLCVACAEAAERR